MKKPALLDMVTKPKKSDAVDEAWHEKSRRDGPKKSSRSSPRAEDKRRGSISLLSRTAMHAVS
jgi:hypothetical protein